ncbi:MAG: cysteine desulfurase [Deltaproteobacteria bacterium]|nr:cysteine desulfurase [Deltaproteobacteria bacterium]
MDVKKVRKDFPILDQKTHGKPLVYLDSAATSQKPTSVIEALSLYYETMNANIHRGIYALSEEATQAFESTRKKVAQFIGAKEERSIVFTNNTTEAINLVAASWGRKNVKAGDEILLTQMEHHSNIVPWQLLAQEQGARLKYIPITSEGELDLSSLDSLLSDRTKILAVTHMSNVLGTINPIKKLIAKAHAKGILVLVDGAQAIPHFKIDVTDLDCDFYAFSAHKMLGPTGVGVLYGKPHILESIPPFLGGGEMILEVHEEYSTWKPLPYKFEAGTPNIGSVIAFAKAIEYLEKIGMDEIRAHEKAITRHALLVLQELEGITIFGPKDVEVKGGVVSFALADIHPHDLGQLLDQEGIAIRAGHHCAQPLMRVLNVAATARASFYLYTTIEEVDFLAETLKKARRYFYRGF